MNPSLRWIFARRSIRAYGRGAVTDAQVKDLLEAAMAAPSACCKDPWHFVVIREPDLLRRIAEALPNGKMLPDAAVGIAVCGSLREAHDGQLSYLIQDVSAAIQNLLLAASALGLGACWLGVHPREERIARVRELLGLSPEVVPIAVIAIGEPGESKEPRTRYREDKVHRGAW